VVVDAFAIMSWQGTPARIVNCRENQTKVMTLAAAEFIRRFLLHILPGGFVRIRQFGFLANRARGKKLALCACPAKGLSRKARGARTQTMPRV